MPPGNPLPDIRALIARWSSQMSSAGLGAVQTTQDYSTLQGQSTYAESYLPKQVGCMRYVRRALGLPQESLPVVSVGAGPRFCLWGWFYDLAPANGSQIIAVDVVDWSPIITASEFLDVERILLSGIAPTVLAPSHFPEDFVSPQCGLVAGTATPAFTSAQVPTHAVVLFPFLLSHFFDQPHKISAPAGRQLGARILEIVRRARVVVIVDKEDRNGGTHWFWDDVLTALGIATAPSHYPTFSFQADVATFASCYPNPLTGGMRTNTFSATGLVLVADGGAIKYYWIL